MVQTQTLKKPVLRSISTIDEDENTYNNLNFKRRRTSPLPVEKQVTEVKKENDTVVNYNSHIDNDSEEDDEEEEDQEEEEDVVEEDDNIFGNSDEDNIFNSDDDVDYYSAISEYESDNGKPVSYYSKSFMKTKFNTESLRAPQSPLHLDENLFDHEESSTSGSASPINSTFNFNDNSSELKSLEENLQKIIDENKQLNNQSASTTESSIPQTQTQTQSSVGNNINDLFVDYLSEEISSDESDLPQSTSASSKGPKFLQYRHDEKHNLAFPDVSTFPVRFDPLLSKKNNGKRVMVRALKRRAILTGQASEMVGTGITMGEFNFF